VSAVAFLLPETVADAPMHLVCAHDLQGRIVSVNPAACRALDMRCEELIGTNLRNILTAEAAASFDDYLAAVAARGVARGMMSVVTRDGKVRVWQYENRLYGSLVSGSAIDVTATALALRKVKEDEQLFRSIFENASDVIAVLTTRSVIRHHNPAMERTLGYRSADLVGSTLLDFVHGEDVDRMREFFCRQADDPTASYTSEVRLRREDGTFRSFEVATRNIVRAGQVEATILNARDVTDRRLLEWQLEQANRVNSLGRLAATVAHEFNNVLMGIQPFAELLERPKISSETLTKCARHIGNSIQRGKAVALDILRFTQPSAPERKPLSVNKWLDHLLTEIEAQCDNSITVTSDKPVESPVILADRVQVAQVITNLTNNARDAMPRGGTLTIGIREPEAGERFSFGIVVHPERFVQISVIDTGSGIRPDVLPHVFEPLFTTKQNGGTGLGLAVAHQVVQRHGGAIFAESRIGAGTAFHIFLPKIVTAEEHHQDQRRPALPCRVRRVLIVDDESAISEGLASMLHVRGFEVSSVDTGGQATPAIFQFQPDVVLLDIGLPDVDGAALGLALRREMPELPIIFSTGHGDRRTALHDENTRFLQKPFTVDELLAAFLSLDEVRVS
jgi:PAS domain S-box-containing protein